MHAGPARAPGAAGPGSRPPPAARRRPPQACPARRSSREGRRSWSGTPPGGGARPPAFRRRAGPARRRSGCTRAERRPWRRGPGTGRQVSLLLTRRTSSASETAMERAPVTPCGARAPSRASAWAWVRGKPSRTAPEAASSRVIRSRTMSMTSWSGTRRPRVMYVAASRPRSVPRERWSRSRPPDSTWARPSCSASSAAWVPFTGARRAQQDPALWSIGRHGARILRHLMKPS